MESYRRGYFKKVEHGDYVYDYITHQYIKVSVGTGTHVWVRSTYVKKTDKFPKHKYYKST